MSTLLTIGFFVVLGAINWFGWSGVDRVTRLATRLYGSIFFGIMALGSLVSLTAAWLIFGAGVILLAIQLKRSII